MPKLKLILLGLVLATGSALAQSDLEEREAAEARMQQAFRDGMAEIVEDLNRGSFERFVAAIDQDDMLERIFGLRLIDPRMKRDFREDMEERGRFEGFIQSNFALEASDGLKATLLLVESRGDRGRAVIRYDLPYFQVNYHEYDLTLDKKDRVVLIDWNDYYWGHKFSDRMGLSMIQAQPNTNAARKLIDFPAVRDQQIFQMMEILKSTRSRDFEKYFEIVEDLDPDMKRQRAIIKLGLDATRQARKRRNQRQILEWVAEYFPEDPLFSIALLDYYFPDKQYENAYNALVRLQRKLRVDDAVMNARLSSATLVLDRVEDSVAYAQRSVEQDPKLELGWWAVFRAYVAAEQYAAAVDALETLEATFGHSLGPDALSKDPAMGSFSRSEEYRNWFEGNRS
ncbi:MAG: hypothetical protein QNJ00_04185 [Woeseiaceae bacterium]|nr:hypothetical protein [Woeseiaceae bacterium]